MLIKSIGNDICVMLVYADDIIFGSTNKDFVNKFITYMDSEFEINLIGELNFFLELQINKLRRESICIKQYMTRNLLKNLYYKVLKVHYNDNQY